MENHSECSDVGILENIVKDVKTSDVSNEIEQLINEMTEIRLSLLIIDCRHVS
jgi:hypothetical protein